MERVNIADGAASASLFGGPLTGDLDRTGVTESI